MVEEPPVPKSGSKISFQYGHVLVNDDNNMEWYCSIPPNTSITLRLKYSVESPLDETLEGLPVS